jgi:hypothetical protein
MRLFRESDDDRVRFMAAQWTYEQAWGKAAPYDPNTDPESRPALDVRALNPEQRAQLRLFLDLMQAGKQVAADASSA